MEFLTRNYGFFLFLYGIFFKSIKFTFFIIFYFKIIVLHKYSICVVYTLNLLMCIADINHLGIFLTQ